MFGPHLQFDLIRLARKGWPTLLRVAYLSILLLGLTVMYRSTENLVKPSQFANRAQVYATVLVLLQEILVLLFLPVYVASAIAQEKESRTLDILFLSHLADKELVLGKLGARLCHLGAIVLAGFPLLIFMHLWGNVDIGFLLFHEANTLLLLLTGGCICIWISAQSESVFQAVTRSYPWLALLGLVGILIAFFSSMTIREWAARWGWGGYSLLLYWAALGTIAVCHLLLARGILRETELRMWRVRREEARRPRKVTGAFALSDKPALQPQGRGRRRRAVSHIHPLAMPIRGSALFWKECLKDGTSWSLRFGWLGVGVVIVVTAAVAYQFVSLSFPASNPERRSDLSFLPGSFTYTSYFICMAAYILVVVFQTTLSVAGEREQDTLVFLQLVPENRAAILFFKWLGPIWRNWPILAIGYLGVLLGLGCGLYAPRTALAMCLLPWPFLLMLSFLALCLSVWCRRVLFANIALVAFLMLLVIGHIATARYIGIVFPFYVSMMFEDRLHEFRDFPWTRALLLACGQQSAFLAMAGACGLLAFWRFGKKEYAYT